MTMERKDIDEHVKEAVSCPILARRLKYLVEDIEGSVPGNRTQQMMYDLVDIILQMGQRLRSLEMRTVPYSVKETLSRQEAHGVKREIDLSTDFPSENEQARHR